LFTRGGKRFLAAGIILVRAMMESFFSRDEVIRAKIINQLILKSKHSSNSLFLIFH